LAKIYYRVVKTNFLYLFLYIIKQCLLGLYQLFGRLPITFITNVQCFHISGSKNAFLLLTSTKRHLLIIEILLFTIIPAKGEVKFGLPNLFIRSIFVLNSYLIRLNTNKLRTNYEQTTNKLRTNYE
jgi:hypothetical protein